MFWRNLSRDRRVWLLVLTAILVVIVSRLVVSGHTAMVWVVRAGYWVLLGLLVLFGRAAWRAYGAQWRRFRPTRQHVPIALLVGVCGAVLVAHERHGFKVLADEELLVGTSMGLHQDRQVGYPIRATDVQGPFQILQRVLDKRPFFFPLLVSFVHDFFGYRPENAFYLNTALGFVFLAMCFVLGRRLGGSVWSGVLLVLLFTGLPLMAQQVTGGGFDLLNLLMIAVVLWLAIGFAERRDPESQEALCLGAGLLAFTRYESILFVVPVAALILWAWRKEQRVSLTWPVLLLPVFLMFCLLHNRVFSTNEASWELAGVPGATTVFGLHYVADNLGHAFAFFFDTTGYQPNSPFFALVGLAAVPFFGLWCTRILRSRGAAPADVAVLCVGLGLFAVWGLLMAYFWGQFDHPVIRRLSLPVHLLMAVSVAVVGRLFLKPRGWQIACGAAAFALVAYSLPVMARRAYTTTYNPAVAMEWRQAFYDRYQDKDYLFIDNDATFWIAHRIPATPAKEARARQEGLMYHLKNASFSAMYVLQHFHVDPETGEMKLDPADELGPDFELEPVWEKRIQTLYIGRISRIKSIRRGDDIARAGMLKVPSAPAANRSGPEWEAARKEYIDNWLKQLP